MRPKVVRSVHYCPATKKTMERKYTDMTSLDAFPSSAIYPTKVRSLAVTFSAQLFSFFHDFFSKWQHLHAAFWQIIVFKVRLSFPLKTEMILTFDVST